MGDNGAQKMAVPELDVGGAGLGEEGRDVNILVTGFGAFKTQYPANPSWEIAHRLPSSIPLPSGGKINILLHPSPIRVSYDVVRGLVPTLWSPQPPQPQPRIDFCLHIGMAAGREFYSVERRAWKSGYSVGDVDGRLPGIGEDGRRVAVPGVPERGADGKIRSTPAPAEAAAELGKEGDDEQQQWESWTDVPEMLHPAVDVDEVLARWRAAVPGEDVRASGDAGRYLCEYIYYASLAHLWKGGEEGRVLFVHVPGWCGERQWERGVRAVVGLVGVVGGLVGEGRGKVGGKGVVKDAGAVEEGVKGEVEKGVYVGGGTVRARE